MLQDGVAESVFANETLRDQGFLPRCLIAQPQTRIGQRFITESEEDALNCAAAKDELDSFHDLINTLLSQPPSTKSNPRELAPRTLKLSPRARSSLIDFANEVERQQGRDGDLAHITGFASKAAEQAARIAGVFTLLIESSSSVVNQPVMLGAIHSMTWYLS